MPPTYATSDTRVFVGNLPQGVDRRDVEDIFHKFGEVTDVWIARNPETGFGFVYFRDRRDAEDACRECNRKEKLGGNMLRVEVSHEQPATDARRGKGSKGGGKGRDDYDDRRDDDVRRNDTVDYRRDDRRDDDYLETKRKRMLSQKMSQFFKSKAFAVVGASSDRSKFGNKVLRWYLDHGKAVYVIHPKEESIEGVKCIRSLKDIPGLNSSLKPSDLSISFITPPNITETTLQEAIKMGVKNVWMQPGAHSPRALKAAEEAGLNFLANGPCILVDTKSML